MRMTLEKHIYPYIEIQSFSGSVRLEPDNGTKFEQCPEELHVRSSFFFFGNLYQPHPTTGDSDQYTTSS